MFPCLDTSALESIEDLEAVIDREFASKAPAASDVLESIAAGRYSSRAGLLQDLVRYLYWTQRYFLSLYVLRPCRWQDRPTGDGEARLALVQPSDEGRRLAEAAGEHFQGLAACWRGRGEQEAFRLLRAPSAAVTYDPGPLCAQLPMLEAAEADPTGLALRVPGPRPDGGRPRRQHVLGWRDRVPELTALRRHAGAIACEHAGRYGPPSPTALRDLQPGDFVLLAWPRSPELAQLLATPPRASRTGQRRQPRSEPACRVGRLRYTPTQGVTIAALAAVTGEIRATNEDLVANAAWHWSSMSSADILDRTGIRQRSYTERALDDIAADAALQALEETGEVAGEVAAVVACSATNLQPMPSLAARIADRAGLAQLAGVWDVVAACAGLPYGLAQAARIVEETRQPVLLVMAEKFSDKLGTVRSSRMLFGDGAAAMLLTPAGHGETGDVHLVQTYAGGSHEEVHAVVWPNRTFHNLVTVDGPGARSIVERYMREILADAQPPAGEGGLWLEDIDLVIPHQANERMVREIARAAGIPEQKLYFNVAEVGNLGGASIPVALVDAIRQGTITGSTRVLAPAFAAGALAGFVLLTVRAELIGAITQGQPAGAGA